jgi:SAM-dependent methyltransferase
LDEKNEIMIGKEIDLLINYPKPKRDINKRLENKTEEVRLIARKFDKDFFDGDRKYGYGGYNYNPKFWEPVIPTFKKYWNLDSNSSVLDIGCGKGFMLYDLQRLIPGVTIAGIDISAYAIQNCKEEVRNFLKVGNASKLPYKDKSFDVVISINTIHNLDKEECAQSLKEISRVAKKASFITVDAYKNEEEKKNMYAWNLTAKTIMSVEEWKSFFKINGYQGDFFWFIP